MNCVECGSRLKKQYTIPGDNFRVIVSSCLVCGRKHRSMEIFVPSQRMGPRKLAQVCESLEPEEILKFLRSLDDDKVRDV